MDRKLAPYTKIHLKWIYDLNIRHEYETLRRKCRADPHSIGFGNYFLDNDTKGIGVKRKNK